MNNENTGIKPFTNKLCLSFFVSGDIYHSYIPFMLYSLFTAYPEHFVIISVKGKLSDDIKNQIRDLGHENNFCIKEDFGNDFPDNPDTWKTLRWVCVHPEYFLFDYVYVGDVDYIFTREDIPLLERKIKVMEMENLPYANTNKCDDPKLRGNRMTGIHFFSVAEYLPPMVETLKKYKDILYSCLPINFYNNKLGKFDNQMALRVMIEEAGLGMPKFNTFE